MDFMNRGNRPAQPSHTPVSGTPPAQHVGETSSKSKRSPALTKVLRITSIALLFSATILVVALLIYLAIGGTGKKESEFVANDRLQAVFLNGGQVYFGKINEINDQYVHLSNIFYLRVNQQVQPESEDQQQATANDISLVKLGCELHRPTNEMVINRDQVVFWENLKLDDGQNTVPGAVAEYLKQFPNGQDCEEEQQTTDTDATQQQTTPTGTGTETSDTPTGADTTQ